MLDLKCTNTVSGDLLVYWKDSATNPIYKATSYMVIVRDRKKINSVTKPEFRLTDGPKGVYQFSVITEN